MGGKTGDTNPAGAGIFRYPKGKSSDENLMNAAMMFNTLIRDGSAIECEDDANEGFHTRY